MGVRLYKNEFKRITTEQLDKWKSIPTAIIGDSQNRQNIMLSRISPLLPGSMAGQAQTISVVAGDNGAIHVAIELLGPNDILVIDGGGYMERALWGGILNTRAIKRGIAGVVIDGAVRDTEELKEMKLPIYCIAKTPAGPHKGWGGNIGGKVSCGGVSVSPGDIIVGDADGIVVVPLDQNATIFDSSLERKVFEDDLMKKIECGEDISGLLKYPEIEQF